MKKQIYSILVTLFILHVGCDDFLSHEPDDRLKINTLEKIANTITGAYNNYGVRFTDVCSDNVGLATGVSFSEIAIEDLYVWSRNIHDQEHQDAPGAYWSNAYQAIANVNVALQALSVLEISEEDQPQADVIKGEGLILRSYYHFMLVNLFAPHYHPVTSVSTLGVPYMKNVEKTLIVHYDRKSVEEVYLLAETDLMEGIRLLEKNASLFQNNKYHFTFPTLYLYASRFYLFRNRDSKDVENAIKYSEKAIKEFGGVGMMRNWGAYATDQYGPVDIKQPEVGMVQESSTWTVYQFAYSMTTKIKNQEFRNPFDLKDLRLQQTYQASGNIFLPAYYFVINSNGSTTAIDIFPLAEAILNGAEAYTRANNFEAAINYLKEFGLKVYENYNPTLLTIERLVGFYSSLGEIENKEQNSLLKYILHERRVHFLFKGMRWFDIRRYDLEVAHETIDGRLLMLSEEVPNKEFQIPRFAIETGMQPNL